MNLIELYKQIYNENKSNNKYIYLDESQFSIVVMDELKQVLRDKKYIIQTEYSANNGIGDIRVFLDNTIHVIELKIIDSIYHFGSGKTIRTSRNKKRNKVIEQVKYYANDTKINYPDKDVIPVTITDEEIQVFSKI
tara:strand:- start:2105 stop:2512 length:408 start_codon:yes stop_codon:yes gene_type:complete